MSIIGSSYHEFDEDEIDRESDRHDAEAERALAAADAGNGENG